MAHFYPGAWRTSSEEPTSFQLSGTGFNGVSQAVSYGDDAQMATNYPLVRLTSATNEVIYCRTFDHSTMGVATGSTVTSTSCMIPAGLAAGTYGLEVIANGIPSAPVDVAITTP